MTSKAFRKGAVDGFFSPAALLAPPKKRRRESQPLSAYLAAESKREMLEKYTKAFRGLEEDKMASRLSSFSDIKFRETDLIVSIRRISNLKALPDVSVGAAWDRVGWLLHEAMALEAEKIDAERSAEKQEATSEGK